MSKQPTEFQKATAEAIVRHLTEHERALCADEAGLGKTITASTVIRELAFQKLTRQLDTAKKWICEWWKDLSKPRKLSVSQNTGGEAKRRVDAFRVFYHSVTGRKAAEDNGNWKKDITNIINALTQPEDIRDFLIAIAQWYADCSSNKKGKQFKKWNGEPMSKELSESMPEPYRVLYICSNLAIAEQNTRELVSVPQRSRRSSTDKPDRLSTLWDYLKNYPTPFLEIYPITSTVSLQDTQGTTREREILEVKTKDRSEKALREARKVGEAKTLEVFSPDLVIFDEFQRFLDIINLISMEEKPFGEMLSGLNAKCSAAKTDGDKEELKDRIEALNRCRKICKGLFSKDKKPKILMLSATPFRDPKAEDRDDLNSLAMKELVTFMGGDAVKYLKAVENGDTAKAQEILYDTCGIFRTERSRLMRKDTWSFHMIRCGDAGVLARAVSIGCDMGGNRGASFALTVPDLSVIPDCYKTDLGCGYAETYNISKGSSEFSLDRFERLRQIVTAPCEADVTENGTRIKLTDADDLKRLLWIPPVAPSSPLGDVFAKYRDYSKTLMYSDLAAVPASVCKELNDEVKTSGLAWNEDTENEIKKRLEQMLGDEELAQSVCGYLKRSGKTALEGKNADDVIQYCEDGCLADVINEWRSFGVTNEEMCSVLRAQKHQDLAVNMTPVLLNASGRREASLRMCFNAPFLPFVLATTSIGAEGLDLHRYCCRLVHYSVPKNPIDLEQKNGRIDRYHSLAQRRRQAQIAVYGEVQKTAMVKSGGMIPDWDAGEGGLHYYFLYTEHTSEKRKIEALFEAHRAYREKLGMKSAAYPESLNLCPFLRKRQG